MSEVTFGWPPRELSPNARAKKWTAEEIAFLRSAAETMTHKEISAVMGRSVNSIRGRCHLCGFVDTSDSWTAAEIERLKSAYSSSVFGSEINLPSLALELGRHKTLVCRKARQLGLTDPSREMLPLEKRKVRKPKFSSKEELSAHTSQRVKKYFAENGHPRGALGMKHTQETKEIISRQSSERWALMTNAQQEDHIMKVMRGREASGTMQTMNRANASWGAAWREIGGVRKYFRSKWEANYARYLEWLKENKQIESWLHEPETFWFDGIKRGCMSYLPDFRVVEIGGAVVFHEVKGWMDDRSRTKIKRMAKYHPSVRLLVIDAKAYKAIKRVMQPIIKEWEVDSKGR